MNVQRVLHTVDGISTWVGKAAAWLIIALMTVVCVEVFKRYILNAPTAWIFDLNNMLYGSLFMLCGAYTLAQNAHVRGDFLYSSMRPRTQASLDLILYVAFFLPGIAALIYAGTDYAADSWRIGEHSNVTADGSCGFLFKGTNYFKYTLERYTWGPGEQFSAIEGPFPVAQDFPGLWTTDVAFAYAGKPDCVLVFQRTGSFDNRMTFRSPDSSLIMAALTPSRVGSVSA